jgi:hypothetical protein
MQGGDDRPVAAPELLDGLGPMRPYARPVILGDPPVVPTWLARAVGEAAHATAPAIRVPHQIYLVIGRAPYEVPLSNGRLVVTPNPEVIATELGGIVFLNVDRLAPLRHQHRVACVLEEFVHSWLNLVDYRELTTVVVATLYGGVVVVNGQWVPVVPAAGEGG